MAKARLPAAGGGSGRLLCHVTQRAGLTEEHGIVLLAFISCNIILWLLRDRRGGEVMMAAGGWRVGVGGASKVGR